MDPLTKLACQRQAEFDKAIAAWRDEAGVRLWCGPGCGNCCSLTVNCTLAEAMAITAGLNDTQWQKLEATVARIMAHAGRSDDARTFLTGYKQAVGPCPFLDEGSNCTIYPARPLACRALLATRPPDWCGVNLADLPIFERDAFLGSLDRSVVTFPTHYAAHPQELAADFERGLTFAMIRQSGFGVTGNLPLLVWLAGDKGFAAALTNGPTTFLQFLSGHQVDRPFLVQIELP